MLPDLRIVIAAVLSTFVLAAGAGFYTSSRLISEPKRSMDSLAALEETPVNRIALSWPAPTHQSEPLALDFAVTAKALRNPVRDVTDEPAAVAPPSQEQTPPVRVSATDLAVQPATRPEPSAPETIAPAPAANAPVVSAPAVTDIQKPAPEPDIRVAVQYPPLHELPRELQAPPVVPSPPAVAATPVIVDAPATTGSVAEPSKNEDEKRAEPSSEPQETKVATRPEPADALTEDDQAIEEVPLPKAKPKVKKPAAKKAATKAAKRQVRPRRAATVPNMTSTFPFGFFGAPVAN